MSGRRRGLPRLRVLLVGALASSAVAAGIGLSSIASAETRLCEQYASTTVGGRYVVMNNRWGSPGPQCITVSDNGFTLSQQDGQGNLSGAPASYPAIYFGCHYSQCSPNSPLPAQLSAMSSVTSQIRYTYVQSGVYDAAYDIWLDPTAKKDGVNKTEIMIWFNHTGTTQPVGTAKGTATVGGRTWTVWTGNNGGNDVVSYVAPAAIDAWNFSVMDFLKDTVNRGFARDNWYLTSIQAGFEPWIGGAGLAVNSFSATVDGGGAAQPAPSTDRPSAPAAAAPTGSGTPSSGPSNGNGRKDNGGPGGCRVRYRANRWPGGFVADVNVTSSSAVNGWSLAFTLPGSQTITHAWNTTVAGSTGAVTAKNVGHNATVPAGGSQSFGFQGTATGTAADPTSFTLNGTACSVE